MKKMLYIEEEPDYDTGKEEQNFACCVPLQVQPHLQDSLIWEHLTTRASSSNRNEGFGN